MTRLGIGPVAAFPGAGAASHGGELRVRKGTGSSDGDSASFVEAEGRLLVTERSQALGVGLGPAYVRWLGPVPITASMTPALGAERFDDEVFFNFSLHGGLGSGVLLRETLKRDAHWGPWFPEMRPFTDDRVFVVRNRLLLTLEIVGAVDGRGTRGPLLSVGALVGLAWIGERYDVDTPVPGGPAPW